MIILQPTIQCHTMIDDFVLNAEKESHKDGLTVIHCPL